MRDEPGFGTGIGPAELEARLVPGLCARATFARGDELRRKGVHYSDMYLIVKGRVDVLPDGRPSPVVMGPGSPVGEIGFLRGCPATATAVAREETTTLVLDDATLWRIERESPMLSVSLLQALADTAELRLMLSVNFFGVAGWYIGYLVINSYSHANFEIKSDNFLNFAGRYLASTTFHSLHHARYINNYGLGTRFLDRAFGTEWDDYENLYTRITVDRVPLKKFSERVVPPSPQAD